MRGGVIFWIILLAASVAAEEIATYQLENGDSILVDEVNVTLVYSIPGNTSMQIGEFGRILREEDCYELELEYFCVDAARNASATIITYRYDYNVSLEREMPENFVVGQEYTVKLRVQNNGPTSAEYLIVENTNATITDSKGFTDNLTWQGVLSMGETKLLSYDAIVDRAHTLTFFANVTGPYNTSDEEQLEFDSTDFFSYSAEFESETVRGEEQNFTITIQDTITEVYDADIRIPIPEEIEITDRGNFSIQDGALTKRQEMNGTYELAFSFSTTESADITVFITTDRNESEVMRTYEHRVTQLGFTQVIILQNHNNTLLKENETTELPIQFFNPNNESITAQLRLASLLLDVDEQLQIPANTTINRTYSVTPERLGSTYNIRLTLTYSDPVNNEIEHVQNIRLLTEEFILPTRPVSDDEQEEISETPIQTLPSMIDVLAQRTAGPNDEFPLYIQFIQVPAENATLQIIDSSGLLYNETINTEQLTSLERTVTGPGTYGVKLLLRNRELESQVIVDLEEQAVANNEEEVERTRLNGLLIISVLVAVGLLVLLAIITTKTFSNRLERITQNLGELQRQLELEKTLYAQIPDSNDPIKAELEKSIREKQDMITKAHREMSTINK